MGTVRFWVWHLEGYVRLALRDGETLRWHHTEPTEEGWSSLATVWSLEGDELRMDEYSNGVDCDGRLSREWHYRCPVRHRDAHAGEMATPLWELDSSRQRDYSAEAMGY